MCWRLTRWKRVPSFSMLQSLIYSRISSHSTSPHLQEHIALPALSVSVSTDSPSSVLDSLEESSNSQLLPAFPTRHWKVMQELCCEREPLARLRNLYLAVSSLMRVVTEVRILARYGIDPALLQRRASALQNEFVAVTFVLPSHIFNPTRRFDREEAADEHQSRLNMLFVFYW